MSLMALDPEIQAESKAERPDYSVPETVAAPQPRMDTNHTAGGRKHVRPEWQLRSPIQDVFVRYGHYYS